MHLLGYMAVSIVSFFGGILLVNLIHRSCPYCQRDHQVYDHAGLMAQFSRRSEEAE